MASSAVIVGSLCSISPNLLNKQTLTLSKSHFLSSTSLSHKQCPLPSLHLRKPGTRNARSRGPVVFAMQSNFAKIIQTAWKVGMDGVEAATNLVPDSVPRPIARIGVTIAMLVVAQFVLRSFLSTAFFVVGTMGFAYFIFLALNKDQGPRGGGGGGGGEKSSDDALEEARRIMEKYK